MHKFISRSSFSSKLSLPCRLWKSNRPGPTARQRPTNQEPETSPTDRPRGSVGLIGLLVTLTRGLRLGTEKSGREREMCVVTYS